MKKLDEGMKKLDEEHQKRMQEIREDHQKRMQDSKNREKDSKLQIIFLMKMRKYNFKLTCKNVVLK